MDMTLLIAKGNVLIINCLDPFLIMSNQEEFSWKKLGDIKIYTYPDIRGVS